jgi:hypothetical protein
MKTQEKLNVHANALEMGEKFSAAPEKHTKAIDIARLLSAEGRS